MIDLKSLERSSIKHAATSSTGALSSSALYAARPQAEALSYWIKQRVNKNANSIHLIDGIVNNLVNDAGLTDDDLNTLDQLSCIDENGVISQFELLHESSTSAVNAIRVWTGEAYADVSIGEVPATYLLSDVRLKYPGPDAEPVAWEKLITGVRPITAEYANILLLIKAGLPISRRQFKYLSDINIRPSGGYGIYHTSSSAIATIGFTEYPFVLEYTANIHSYIKGLTSLSDEVRDGLADFADKLNDVADQGIQVLDYCGDLLSSAMGRAATDVVPLISGGLNSALDSVHTIASAVAAVPKDNVLDTVLALVKDHLSSTSAACENAILAAEDGDPGAIDVSSATQYDTVDVCAGAWELIQAGATAAFSIMMVAGGAILKTVGALGYGAFMLTGWFIQQASLREGATINFETNDGFEYANPIRICAVVPPSADHWEYLATDIDKNDPIGNVKTVTPWMTYIGSTSVAYNPYSYSENTISHAKIIKNALAYPAATGPVYSNYSDFLRDMLSYTGEGPIYTHDGSISFTRTPTGSAPSAMALPQYVDLTINVPHLATNDTSADELRRSYQFFAEATNTGKTSLAWTSETNYDRLDLKLRAFVFRSFILTIWRIAISGVRGRIISRGAEFRLDMNTDALTAMSTHGSNRTLWKGVQGLCAACAGFPIMEGSRSTWNKWFPYISAFANFAEAEVSLFNDQEDYIDGSLPRSFRGIFNMIDSTQSYASKVNAFIMGDLPIAITSMGLVEPQLDSDVPGFPGRHLSEFVPSWAELNDWINFRCLSLSAFIPGLGVYFPDSSGVPEKRWFSLARKFADQYRNKPQQFFDTPFGKHISYSDALLCQFIAGLDYYSRCYNQSRANPIPEDDGSLYNAIAYPSTILKMLDGCGRDIDQAYNAQHEAYYDGALFLKGPDCVCTDRPSLVDKPAVIPPKAERGSTLRAVIIASVVMAVTITAYMVIKRKITRWRKVRAIRAEQKAIAAQNDVLAASKTDVDYQKKVTAYTRSTRKFQRVANRVGYSSNSLGTYTAGDNPDVIKTAQSTVMSALASTFIPPDQKELDDAEYDPSASVAEKLNAINTKVDRGLMDIDNISKLIYNPNPESETLQSE